jgi:AraC-like DNA-binding protein
VRVGGVQINQFDGTMSRIARTATSISRGPDDDFCILLNRGAFLLGSRQIGGCETTLPPGSATLLRFDTACETLANDQSAWVGLTVNGERLLSMVNGTDALLSRRIDGNQAAVHLLRRHLDSIVALGDIDNDHALDNHIDTTIVDLVALALGAGGDSAELASLRGLRAARLQAILVAIRAGFTDPTFSSQALANGLGLSRRYVNDLLYESGGSFAERVLELRLQKARAMLGYRRNDKLKVSEIAYACGFNEVSYFNRCFRRRFGASPTQYRGKD